MSEIVNQTPTETEVGIAEPTRRSPRSDYYRQYYQAHKDEKISKALSRYYARKEEILAKAKARYQARKALSAAQPPIPTQ